jgi:secreted trypsin-like serine protease
MNKLLFLLLTLVFIISCGDNTKNLDNRLNKSTTRIVEGKIPGEDQIDAVTLSTIAITNEKMLSENKTFCTGTIIRKNVVMTAAHCVNEKKADEYFIVFGRTVSQAKKAGNIYKVLKVKVHKRYISSTLGKDIALILLENNIPQGFEPTPTYGGEINRGDTFRISGFGVTGFGNPSTETGTLRQATVYLQKIYLRNQLVLKGKNGEDTCQGDSGGPAYIVVDDKMFVAGITSWGRSCGIKGYYTDVRLYSDWIDETIEKFF